MLALVLLSLIFSVTIIIIWLFPPDTMQNAQGYKASVKDLWGVIRICQTSNFGKPSLTLRPAKRSVEMILDFPDTDRVCLSVPLLLKKQKQARKEYIELFTKHNLTSFESKNQVTVYLDRNDENLGHLVVHLYRKVFEASNTDTVNFTAKAVGADLRPLQLFKRPKYKINPDYKFEAPSARHKGKSASGIQISRVLNAVYWLLYPPMIILSYKFFDLNIMCWAALVFLGFFTFYRTVHQGKRLFDSWGNILYCILILATLVTHDARFLQSIPSGIGIGMAILSAALAVGILKPKSASDILQKERKPKEFIIFKSFWVFGGIGLFLINEWARKNLDLENWVWFFGLVRLELMIAMAAVFIPVYAIFLHKKVSDANA